MTVTKPPRRPILQNVSSLQTSWLGVSRTNAFIEHRAYSRRLPAARPASRVANGQTTDRPRWAPIHIRIYGWRGSVGGARPSSESWLHLPLSRRSRRSSAGCPLGSSGDTSRNSMVSVVCSGVAARPRCGCSVEGAAGRTTDNLAEATSARRAELLDLAVDALQLGRELAVASASREARAGLRELAAVLKRDQTRFKNFSLFDRLKAQPERAAMLLKLLPVWIMTPDDVARLFPCEAVLFDVVIVDEASQVDLPSITPIAYRGKKLVVFGDSKQMQPRRFAFMSQDVTRQAWQQTGMKRLDSDRWLHPSEQSLLTLTQIRAEEETLLDEHFRSLPPIIRFSNERWYDGKLRIMADERQKRFGSPEQAVIRLHQVENGIVSNGSQENEVEARRWSTSWPSSSTIRTTTAPAWG